MLFGRVGLSIQNRAVPRKAEISCKYISIYMLSESPVADLPAFQGYSVILNFADYTKSPLCPESPDFVYRWFRRCFGRRSRHPSLFTL